jgi:hypothetical protein
MHIDPIWACTAGTRILKAIANVNANVISFTKIFPVISIPPYSISPQATAVPENVGRAPGGWRVTIYVIYKNTIIKIWIFWYGVNAGIIAVLAESGQCSWR